MNSALAPQPVYYRLSGKVSPQALFIGLPFCLGLGAVVGFIAGMLEFLGHVQRSTYILVIGEALVVAGTGAFLGFASSRLLDRLGSRSKFFDLLCVLATSLIAVYFAWAGWIFHFFVHLQKVHSPLLFLNPIGIVRVAGALYDHGVYTLLRQKVEGPIIVFFWIAEAAGIVGIAMSFAWRESAQNVYCENCKDWGTRRTLMQFRDVNTAEIKAALLAGNFDALSSVCSRDFDEDCWCSILLEGCPKCDNSQTLTLQRTLFFRQQNGRTSTKNTSLIHRLLLTPEQTAKIAVIAASLEPPSEPAA